MALIEKRPRVSGKTTYRVRVKYRGRVLSATHTDRLSRNDGRRRPEHRSATTRISLVKRIGAARWLT